MHIYKHLAASLWRAVRATANARCICASQPHLRVCNATMAPVTLLSDVLRGSSRAWVHSGTAYHAEPAPVPSNKMVQFPLAQTGEGIKECELIAWFVKVCC